MIGNIRFHTNLDLAREFLPFRMGELWDHIPPVGTILDIALPMTGNPTFDLEVKSIRISVDGGGVPTIIRVELHIPTYDPRSIAEWEKWMNRRLGRE